MVPLPAPLGPERTSKIPCGLFMVSSFSSFVVNVIVNGQTGLAMVSGCRAERTKWPLSMMRTERVRRP